MRWVWVILLASFTAMGMVYGRGRDVSEARASFRQFERLAENGDREAQYRLALILEQGWDTVAPDSARALRLMRRSAEALYPPAMNHMGYLYGHGYYAGGRKLVAVNADSARMWLRRSADMADPRAMANIAFLLLNDSTACSESERNHNDSVAYRYLIQAADMKVPTALSMLGDMWRDGRWVGQDSLKAMLAYEGALAKGLADAQSRLISLMAPRWQRLSADSALNLGLRYYTTVAPAAGVILFEQVGDSVDNPLCGRALALLGDAYSRGAGVAYGYDKSLEYFTKAAKKGNPSAMFILAETLEMFPDAVNDTSINDAEELRRRAAEAGIKSAHDANKALLAM